MLRLASASSLTACAVDHFGLSGRGPDGAIASTLTEREWAVSGLIAGGSTSEEIARSLEVSHLTVRKHRENTPRKLNARRCQDLLRLPRQPPDERRTRGGT